MIIKRKWWNFALIILAAFIIGAALSLAIVGMRARAETGPLTCGDGVCQATENSDLCIADCECHDNGIADPGEGCGCKDVVCASLGEGPKSACGTPCNETYYCPEGLSCYKGTCWNGFLCAGDTGVEEESGGGGGGSCTPGPVTCSCYGGYNYCSDGCSSYISGSC